MFTQVQPNTTCQKKSVASLNQQKKDMGNFSKAWAFTSGWEGGFDGQRKPNPLPLDDSTAVYGITPKFLVDFLGWTTARARNKNLIAGITKADAGELWRQSRWTWFRCEQFEDDLATLIFDVSVRRPTTAYLTLCQIAGLPTRYGFFKKNVTLPYDDVFEALKNMDSKEVYDKLVVAYIKRDNPFGNVKTVKEANVSGVVRRMASLLQRRLDLDVNSFVSDLTYDERVVAENNIASLCGVKIDRKRKLTTDTPKKPYFSKLAWGGVAVFVLGKIFKKW